MDDPQRSCREAIPDSGLRFACQGSGRCCTARDGYGYVYLSLQDRRRLATLLSLRTAVFTRRYCQKTGGLYHLADPDADCRFLRGRACSVYEARPTQCRAWPFWTENLRPGVWEKEVASFCPGVGKGPVFSRAAIVKLVRASDVRDFD